MFGSSLDGSLGRVWKHASRDTKADLGADDTGVRGCTGAAAEVDEQTEGDQEETCAEDDEGFEAADFEDDEAEGQASEDGGEAVERTDTGSALDGLVESDDEDSVQEVALHVPC